MKPKYYLFLFAILAITINQSLFAQCDANFSASTDLRTVTFTNLSAGTNLSYHWSFGDQTTSTEIHPLHTYTQAGNFQVKLTIESTVPQCIDSVKIYVSSYLDPDTISGRVYMDKNKNGIFDPGDVPVANKMIYSYGSYDSTDIQGSYQVIHKQNTSSIDYAYIGLERYMQGFDTVVFTPQKGWYGLKLKGGEHQREVNFGLLENTIKIQGLVYEDNNLNGIFDYWQNDTLLVNQKVTITDSLNYFETSYTGNGRDSLYCFFVPIGPRYYIHYAGLNQFPDYQVTEPLGKDYYYISSTSDSIYMHRNFGIHPVFTEANPMIDAYSLRNVVQGFPAVYSMNLKNFSPETSIVDVVWNYDTKLSFDSASINATQIDEVNNIITWNNVELSPFSSINIMVYLKAKLGLTMGSPVFNHVCLSPVQGTDDYDLSDNCDSIQQVVRGAFDPNDKSVDPAGDDEFGYLRTVDKLKYTIRFENIGDLEAVNIAVIDTLDNDLDLNSFNMLGASHNYTVSLQGNIVTWNFPNINLPYKSADPIGSNGYVCFEIKPEEGWGQGSQFTNFADIYFDFNDLIRTNTCYTTIDFTMDTKTISKNNSELNCYPNPASDKITIQYLNSDAKTTNYYINDLSGKMLIQKTVPVVANKNNQIEVSTASLPSGIYLLQLSDGAALFSRKIVIVK